MEKHDFTLEQNIELIKLLDAIRESRDKGSEISYNSVQFYKDSEGNIYSSYYIAGYEKGEPMSRTEYVKIDKEGKRTYLLNEYSSEIAITRKLDKMEKIKL